MAAFLYVGSSDSQDISVFSLDAARGTLAPLATVPVPGSEKPGGSLPLAVSPDRRFLFAALRSEPFQAATFAIDPNDGSLRHAGSGPLDASMAYIATDRTGRFLLAASYPASMVTVSPIGADGVVGPAIQKVPTGPNAHAIITDRSNRHVFHTSLGGDAVYQQLFDSATGKLSPNDPSEIRTRTRAGPRHLAFSPDEKFLYVLTELDATVYVFACDRTKGVATQEVQIVSAMPPGSAEKPWGADIHLTPDGRHLYASERTTSTIAAFGVDTQKGTLTPLGSFATERQPRAFAIDPSGKFLFAAGEESHGVSGYAIDPESGALARIARMPAGRKPNWIEIVAFP